MVSIVINPGTGPVANAADNLAAENMQQFVKDLTRDGIVITRVPDKDYGEGRFAFVISNGIREHEVQMPGIPLADVRYTGGLDQNIWHFPRLYVDGNSWVWKFGISVLEDDSEWQVETEDTE